MKILRIKRIIIFLIFCLSFNLFGENNLEKKEMFRGVWVATVENIDFPKKENGRIRNSKEELQEDWTEILNRLQSLNMNAVIFQVSPVLDAFYESENRPWSKYLTGKAGQKPEWADKFDLIEWMIDESHKRGIEFHAWFNPYRVTFEKNNLSKSEKIKNLPENNFAKKKESCVYEFLGSLNLDPGCESSVKHFQDTVQEFMQKYDVDAIHIDDYFYPYSEEKNGKTYVFGDRKEDEKTLKKYPRNFKDIKAWRTNNITALITNTKKVIDRYNKINETSVQWGVSPFGIWDTNKKNPEGANIPLGTATTLRTLYADTRKWLQNESIDYIVPQIYWEINHKIAPYDELVKWWDFQDKGKRTQIYVGHGNYKPKVADEMPLQLAFNNEFENIKGSVFFSYKDIEDSAGFFKNKALVPPKPWLKKTQTFLPESAVVQTMYGGYEIKFKDPQNNNAKFYVIYGTNDLELDENNSENILKVVGKDFDKDEQIIFLTNEEAKKKKYFWLTIIDRAGVESKKWNLQ